MADKKQLIMANGETGLPTYVPNTLKDLGDGTYAPVVQLNNPSSATSANQVTGNTALGLPTDTMVTDATASGSIIALLKGILQESVAQASSASFTAYNLTANVATTVAASTTGKGRIVSSVSGTILVGVGFTATANNWSYRVVTNGTIEIKPEWAALSLSLFSTAASTVNVTVMS